MWGVLIAGTMMMACASSRDDALPDAGAGDPRVYVEDHLTNWWPTTMAPVSFRAPDGSAIEATPPSSGGVMYTAAMPDGGSVLVFQDLSGSPTSQAHRAFWVDGLEPGDHFVFGKTPASLPSDCVCRDAAWTLDSGRAVWTDPDAASVDARIVRRESETCVFDGSPPYYCDTTTEIDGRTETSIDAKDPSVLKAITVVACPGESYRDIRTALAGGARCSS
jgi:hypothetical protein